jgi:hypothetical protein
MRLEPFCSELHSEISDSIEVSKKLFATGNSARNSSSVQIKENRMKPMKISAVVFASLAVLALSLPVWSQDTTQSTTTTTTPSAPETKTTQTTKENTKVTHHKRVKKEKTTTTTTTKPAPETQSQTTTTTTPAPQ